MNQPENVDIAQAVRQANIDYHNLIAGEYENDVSTAMVFNQNAQAKLEGIVLWLKDHTEGRQWIDLGCGTGNVLKFAESYFDHALGLDISTGMLEIARQRGGRVAIADIRTTPVSPASTDVVSAYSVLHHLFDPMETLREAYRILKPGGFLYTEYDPNSRCLLYWPVFKKAIRLGLRLIHKLFRKGKEVQEDSRVARMQAMAEYHHNYTQGLDPRQLIEDMKTIGFSDVRIIPLFNVLDISLMKRKPLAVNLMIYPLFSIIAQK